MILHKLGSKDFVSTLHEFLLVNLLSFKEVNLPNVLFTNFKKNVNKRVNKLSFHMELCYRKL